MPREHFEQELRELQDDLLRLASFAETAIGRAIKALHAQSVVLARQVIAEDDDIDAAQYALEERALTLIAMQQPLARDLRIISAAMSIAGELERMGDYAEGIAEITIRSAAEPLLKWLVDIPRMAALVLQMLHQALGAYIQRDVEAAWALSVAEAEVDQLTAQVQNELIAHMIRNPQSIERAIHLLYVAHNLERIADRTTNIGERIIFMVTGQIVDLNP